MLETDKNKNKKRLGRGLGSLFSEEVSEPGMVEEVTKETPSASAPPPQQAYAGTAVKAPVETPAIINVPPGQRIWTVGIDKVFPNKSQPRKDFDGEKIKELAASIKEQGILQPITVRKTAESTYEIIAGERRWRAAQAAGLHEVPVIVKEAENKQVLEWALIENIQREDLNPIEEAEAFNQLIGEFKYTHQELADKMGKERATVTNSLRLLTLARDVRELLREQKISQGHAKALLSLDIPEQQRNLAAEIVKKGLSVRAVEKEVARMKKGEAATAAPTEKENLWAELVESLAGDLQKKLGTKVKIDYAEGKGRIVVNFYSDDELTSLVETIKGDK